MPVGKLVIIGVTAFIVVYIVMHSTTPQPELPTTTTTTTTTRATTMDNSTDDNVTSSASPNPRFIRWLNYDDDLRKYKVTKMSKRTELDNYDLNEEYEAL